MSLDVYLNMPGEIRETSARIFIRENGQRREVSREEWDAKFPGTEPVACITGESNCVYQRNITHNLNRMANAAGIYKHLWRPEEIGITKAAQLIEPLREGLRQLRADPAKFEQFNAPNGWGLHEHLVSFVADYLAACVSWPEAEIEVSR